MKATKEILIENQTHDEERALYNLTGAKVTHCRFAGEADGESALKECKDLSVEHCAFSLRYPLWHVHKFRVWDCGMDEKTRAALWYCKDGVIKESNLNGIKALRECQGIRLDNCQIQSPEFGWRCKDITMRDTEVKGEYFMFESKKLNLENVALDGKYSFQYVENAQISICNFKTKDAFWHSKNVVVKDSILKGEYLGWYSDGLTLINCDISGTQPLCYCKNLKLINCRMNGCDLAFEYSDVNATVTGKIDSVKNPKSGKIIADEIGEIIFENANIPCKGKVITRKGGQ